MTSLLIQRRSSEQRLLMHDGLSPDYHQPTYSVTQPVTPTNIPTVSGTRLSVSGGGEGTPGQAQSASPSTPQFHRTVSLTLPHSASRPRSASDFPSRSQSLSSLDSAIDELSTDKSFVSVSQHIKTNYEHYITSKRRFIVACVAVTIVGVLSLVYTVNHYYVTSTTNHLTLLVFGFSLLWLLLSYATGLYRQKMTMPSQYIHSINKWMRVFGIEFDRKTRSLKVLTQRAISQQRRKEQMRLANKLAQSPSPVVTHTPTALSQPVVEQQSRLYEVQREAERQRWLAVMEEEQDMAGPEAVGTLVSPSDFPKVVNMPHRHEADSVPSGDTAAVSTSTDEVDNR